MLDIKTAAATMGMSPRKLKNLCEEKKIPAGKTGQSWLIFNDLVFFTKEQKNFLSKPENVEFLRCVARGIQLNTTVDQIIFAASEDYPEKICN